MENVQNFILKIFKMKPNLMTEALQYINDEILEYMSKEVNIGLTTDGWYLTIYT
uniref:Uncharacterized protein n=1 Tax=Arundo donax TaxID=35708 RepID=A0A0A9S922_ARUDO